MGDSKIEWTDKTWNPVAGCSKVSPGCKHCYAETIAERFRGQKGFENGFDLALKPHKLPEPLSWRKPARVFVNSMSDLFHKGVPNEYIAAVFGVMAAAPQHTFQVLTKRSERLPDWFRWVKEERGDSLETVLSFVGDKMVEVMGNEKWAMMMQRNAANIACDDDDWPLPNVHIGVSAEDQQRWDERVPHLEHVPAVVKFVSVEPMLGPVIMREQPVDWVICGGESGPGARPMAEQWARDLRDQCKTLNVPFMLKQLGGHPNKRGGPLAVLDGVTHQEFPT